MHPSPTPQPDRASFVNGFLWFVILSGFLMIQFVIGGGIPSGPDQGEPPALQKFLPLAPALLAWIVRLFVLPRIDQPAKQLPAMLIALALAEATGFLGLFFISPTFPSTRLTCFVVAVLTILALAPIPRKKRPDAQPYLK